MRKFILKTVFIGILPICLFVGMGTLFSTSYNLLFKNDKPNIILGASDTRCSIDDNIVSSCHNLCETDASYLYTYLKLRLLTNNQKNIQTVIIGYSPVSLGKKSNPSMYAKIHPLYLSLLSLSEWLYVLDNYPHILNKIFTPAIGYNYMKSISEKNDITQIGIGSYQSINSSSKLSKDVESRKNKRKEYRGISEFELFWLQKTVKYCKSNNINIVLLHTPMFHVDQYMVVKPAKFIRETYFKDIPYWDYSNINLPDSCYEDIGHLNQHGATIFSNIFKGSLQHLSVDKDIHNFK